MDLKLTLGIKEMGVVVTVRYEDGGVPLLGWGGGMPTLKLSDP